MNDKERAGIAIMWAGFILAMLALVNGVAKANPYGFPPTPPQPTVLMHIEYSNGGGGTHTCADLRDCYVKHLDYEARGAAQYCRKITITSDGKVRWWRKYQ